MILFILNTLKMSKQIHIVGMQKGPNYERALLREVIFCKKALTTIMHFDMKYCLFLYETFVSNMIY